MCSTTDNKTQQKFKGICNLGFYNMNSDGIEDVDYESDSELRFLRIKPILIINFIIDAFG